MRNLPSRSISFRPEINGLRAVAVLLVILFHLEKEWMPFGYVGVDIFFVISGFLITRIILKDQSDGRFSFGDFIVRRIKRILPALFLVLLVCSIVSIIVFSSEEFRYFFRSLRYASAQGANFFFLGNSGYFDLDSKFNVLLHTWSLGVEEQFYLVWPVLLLMIAKFRISRVIFFVMVISLSFTSMWYFRSIESMQAFFMFYARAWEFAIGGILAVGVIRANQCKAVNEVISILGVLCVIISLLVASSSHHSELYYLLLTCIGVAGIIYSSMDQPTLIARLLSCKLLLYIGALSYSLYLWHWPVIVYYNYILEFFMASKGESVSDALSVSSVIIILALTWLLSVLTFKYIENPYRTARAGNKQVYLIAIVCILSFMGLAKLTQKQAKASWRLSNFSEEVSLDDLEIKVERLFDSTVNPEDVLLIGDSHSEHFTPMIEEWAKMNNLQTKTLYKGGTPPLLVYEKYESELTYRQKRHLDKVRNHILNTPTIKHVFIAASHTTYQDDPRYEMALADTIKFLIAKNKGVCILGQVPSLAGNGIRYIEPTHLMSYLFPKKLSNETLLAYDHDLVESQLSPMRGIMARLKLGEPAIQLWHPENYIDSGLQNGLPCYSDKSHLNKHGSLYLAPYFQYQLDLTPQ